MDYKKIFEGHTQLTKNRTSYKYALCEPTLLRFMVELRIVNCLIACLLSLPSTLLVKRCLCIASFSTTTRHAGEVGNFIICKFFVGD